MIKEPSIETLVKELINGLSVRAIKGHAEVFQRTVNAFINAFETNRKELLLLIEDENKPFNINVLCGKELDGIVTINKKGDTFTVINVSDQRTFEFTKETVKEYITRPNLKESFLIESKEDASNFFQHIFKLIPTS
ncbi:hypothetical protein IT403_00175 [Candidatus Nomurabacteria bacterium]|nr:hypothetical protein [Candidatus Nomurabacteria bacterium]